MLIYEFILMIRIKTQQVFAWPQRWALVSFSIHS